MDVSKLGKFIRERREMLGMSLRNMEKACQLSDSYLCLLEQGKRRPPPMDRLKRLAKTLDVPLLHLLEMAGCFDEKGGVINGPA